MRNTLGKLMVMGLGLLTFPAGAQPVINQQPTNQVIVNGGNVTFGVGVSGVGPFTYQWQFNGTNLPNNLITTVAGNGSGQNSGDGGQATNAAIRLACGIVSDNSGIIYIADTWNNRIRKVDTNGIISTIAGKASASSGGDGGAATNAGLYFPYGLAMDSTGNLFIADSINCQIRKIDTNGIITTVAGMGSSGYSGNGGAATNASLNQPHGVSVDGVGNLFIADYGNNCIRKVDTNGIITTVAGNGIGGTSIDGILATNASLVNPQGVAFDAYGNLLLSDSSGNRVRMVDSNGIINAVAGHIGLQGYSGDGGNATNAALAKPTGITVDSFGYLFIADSVNNRIRQVDRNGIISTVAGNGSGQYSGDGGAATNSALNQPFGLMMDPSGCLLVADMNNNRIRKVTLGRIPFLQLTGITTNNAGNYQVIIASPSGSVTSSVVSLSVAFPPSIITQPQSMMVSNGAAASMAVTVSGTGPLNYQWYFNNTALNDATNAALPFSATTFDQAGNYFCIVTNNYGRVVSAVVTLAVWTPPSIVMQPTNQTVVLGNSVAFNVEVMGTGPFKYQWRLNGTNLPDNAIITTVAGNRTNGYAGDGGAATNANISGPWGVALDAVGNLFIADYGNNRVRKVDTNGVIATVAGTGSYTSSGDGGAATNAGFAYISAIAVDASNNLFIADMDAGKIRKVDTNGIITTIVGKGGGYSGDGGPATNASLTFITGVAVDASGNLFIADMGNNRTRKVNTNGIISTLASGSSYGVGVDNAGNVFIADGANRVRKVDTNGILTIVAGNGTYGSSGDGGPATSAALYSPYSVAVDCWGNWFIADKTTGRVRKVDANGIISTVAGGGSNTKSDGGLATNESLGSPEGVAVDAAGNLYISESSNHRIRKVNLAGSPTLTFLSVSTNRALLSASLPTNSVFVALDGSNPASAGNFSVVVTSPYGSVTSTVASLTVLLPPSITSQPSNVSVTNGAPTSFNVVAAGTAPLSYQWFTSSGRCAVAVPSLNSGGVRATVTSGGSGYTSVPQVNFVGGSGFGASGTAVINNGMVTAINMIGFGGFNYYASLPVIRIDNPSAIIQPLADQTNATLSFSSATDADATNYCVVVTSNYGSVTSAMVGLTIFLPPQNFIGQTVAGGLQFHLNGTPNYPYILQSATNLTPPVDWKSFRTNYADINGLWEFIDTNLNVGQKYYRVFGR